MMEPLFSTSEQSVPERLDTMTELTIVMFPELYIPPPFWAEFSTNVQFIIVALLPELRIPPPS